MNRWSTQSPPGSLSIPLEAHNMQHTLIPLKDRQRLHREYIIRAMIVTVFAVAVSIVVGVGALFPAYVKALFYSRVAKADLAIEQGNKASEDLQKAKAKLDTDSKLLFALASSTSEIRFSSLVRSVVSARSHVSITRISFNQIDPKAVSVTLKGVAPTRDELLSFKTRIETSLPGTKIDIPIDQLAKSINTAYDWKFITKLP